MTKSETSVMSDEVVTLMPCPRCGELIRIKENEDKAKCLACEFEVVIVEEWKDACHMHGEG